MEPVPTTKRWYSLLSLFHVDRCRQSIGALDFSLTLWCTPATHLRGTKSLYRTAPSFSILNGKGRLSIAASYLWLTLPAVEDVHEVAKPLVEAGWIPGHAQLMRLDDPMLMLMVLTRDLREAFEDPMLGVADARNATAVGEAQLRHGGRFRNKALADFFWNFLGWNTVLQQKVQMPFYFEPSLSVTSHHVFYIPLVSLYFICHWTIAISTV